MSILYLAILVLGILLLVAGFSGKADNWIAAFKGSGYGSSSVK